MLHLVDHICILRVEEHNVRCMLQLIDSRKVAGPDGDFTGRVPQSPTLRSPLYLAQGLLP